jgi:hypothetical protein
MYHNQVQLIFFTALVNPSHPTKDQSASELGQWFAITGGFIKSDMSRGAKCAGQSILSQI